MDDAAPTEPDGPLDAGVFSTWLVEVREAIRGEHDAEVPCDGCTACCTASQFVHIGPDEPETLARIPAELLFPAPGRPVGHVLMGYDERGHCPMLVDDACSIYEHRPRTCRTYDCRVFAATDVWPDEPGKQAIAARARRWQFGVPTPADTAAHEATRARAARIVGRSRQPGEHAPTATQAAVAAVLQASDPPE